MCYRPEIDGLRAVAVLAVILFHAGFPMFEGGYIGVDVFFVISGYLITKILINDFALKRFSFVEFYERRARRIFPALVFTGVCTAITAWIILNPIELSKFGGDLIGVATFSSNVVFWKSGGYFEEASEINPLIHTWSLSVEEQWYILFPLILFTLWRLSTKHVFSCLVIFAVVSFLLSDWGARNMPAANFFLVPTRAWELLAGSITAFVIQKRGVCEGELLSALGGFLLLLSIAFLNKSTPFPSALTLLPVVGTVLIIMFGSPTTHITRLLSKNVLVGIGLISYSAYLIHQPIFAFTRLYIKSINLSAALSAFLILISFGIAYLSWRYIENPIRSRLVLSRKKTLMVASAVSLATLGCIGLASKKASDGHEMTTAKELSDADYVYFSNLNERKFTEARLFYPLKETRAIVMGSSRIMQVGSDLVGSPSLNLSVSGASVEDYIAYVGESVAKLKPLDIYLGADPWLFNQLSGQDRWKTSPALFLKWSEIIRNGEAPGDHNAPNSESILGNPLQATLLGSLYQFVNIRGSLIARDGLQGAVAKKSYDGRHIYDEKYASLSTESIKKRLDGTLDYSMKYFEYDLISYDRYAALVVWLKNYGFTVSLVLSPYHPEVYDRMKSDRPIFLEVETKFRRLGEEFGINVLGSYDPSKVGCNANDFYDGMHPKEGCMAKVFQKIRFRQ